MKIKISLRLCVSARVLFLLLSFSLFAQDYIFEDNEGITITGTQATSQQISVIEKEEIDQRNAQDLANLLQDVLNLNIVRYGAYGNQAGINLRGFDGKRVAFLIDGVPANSSIDGKFDINQIDLNNVERIEVIYGGSDSKFNVSGSLGGVVNIITLKKQPDGWRFGFSASNTSLMPCSYYGRDEELKNPHWESLFDSQNYTIFAGYGAERFSFSSNAFFNRAQNQFLFEDFSGTIRRKDNNEVWDTGAGVSLTYNLSNLSKLLYSGNFYYGDKNFPVTGFSSSYGNQKDTRVSEKLMLFIPQAGHEKIETKAVLAWNFNRRDYISHLNNKSRHDQFDVAVINRWNWFLSETITLKTGIDYNFKFLDSSEIGNRNRHDGGIYFTAEIKPIEQFLIIPSVKTVANFGENTQIVLIPKLGLLWNITEKFAIKNNYFRSFKFPDFEELYWSGGEAGIRSSGNPNLKSEDGWGADLGADWKINNFIQMENTVFAQWLFNSIHWQSTGSGANTVWQPENAGEAVFFGIDNKLYFNLPVFKPFDKISFSVSYQYLRSYLLSFGYDFIDNKRIPYNPEHTFGGSLNLTWKTGNAVISGHYEGLRFHDRMNLIILDPYFLLNVSVNQNLSESVTMFAALRNILNTGYESYYDYPMPGFSVTIGIKVNFSQRHREHREEN